MQKTIWLFLLLSVPYVLSAQATFFKSMHNGRLTSISPAANGGLVGGGTYIYNSSVQDIFRGILVKSDAQGSVEWAKYFPSIQRIRSSKAVADGYLITGDTSDLFWPMKYLYFAKLDTLGEVIWAQKFTTERQEYVPGQVFELPDGGYILYGGVVESFFANGVAMCRTDANGNVIWSKVYKSSHPTFHGDYLVQAIQGDTLYATGQVQGNGIFVRINVQSGEMLGVSSFGGIYREGFRSLIPTPDGNFMLGGMTRSTTGSEEERPWIVKVNRVGQIIWSRTYNIPGWNQGCEITGTDDGGAILSTANIEGGASSQSIFAKIDSAGNFLWANNYTSGLASGLESLIATSDNGYVAIDRTGKLLKINGEGRTHNGCCPVPIIYEVTDFNPPYQSLTLSATDWRSAEPVTLQNHTDTLFALQDACATAIATVVSSIHVCQGDVWAYNGQVYTAPGTVRDTVYNPSGGCDTVFVYNLVQIPQPFLVNTLSTCPGSEIVLNGITYTQPDTISIMLPATSGCDTLLVVFLRFDQWPKKYQITTFCPGDTVFLNGWYYTFPGVVFPPDTIPGPANGCDTLLFQKLEYPSVPSEVTVICPENIWAQTAPGNTVPVFFDIPQAETTCPCEVLDIWQASGLPSGAGFSAGVTELCFWAKDICGAYSPCCFTVNVEEIAACDTKQSGPVLFELLDISSESNGDLTYRMRIRNESNAPVAYVAFALPDGANALTPLNGSTYQTLSGRDYLVKNPNAAPFKSIRFKADDPVLSNGLEDIFAYTIPAQYGISFVQSIVKLTNGAFYEAKLNTFGCADAPNRPDSRGVSVENPNQTFTVFPNPSNGQIAVQWSTGMASGFVLRNVLGQEVARYSSVSGANMEILQLPATMANGMYLLEMFTGKGERQSLWFQLER